MPDFHYFDTPLDSVASKMMECIPDTQGYHICRFKKRTFGGGGGGGGGGVGLSYLTSKLFVCEGAPLIKCNGGGK